MSPCDQKLLCLKWYNQVGTFCILKTSFTWKGAARVSLKLYSIYILSTLFLVKYIVKTQKIMVTCQLPENIDSSKRVLLYTYLLYRVKNWLLICAKMHTETDRRTLQP